MFSIESPEFVSFLSGCQTLVNDNLTEHGYQWEEVLTAEQGPRYIRVVKTVHGNQRSAWCFVDRTNGDVLKCAGWKAPAKHARGNLTDPKNGLGLMSSYGPAYLR